MPHVIACPNCEKKLAVKEELKGRALICPQCKGRFTVPADDAADDDPLGLQSEPAPAVADDGGVGFLDNLGPATKGESKAAAATSSRPAGKPPSTAAASGLARASANRARKQAEQMKMIYIAGGVAGAVLLLIIIVAVAMSSSGGSSEGGQPKDEGDIRFGLKESERIALFKRLISAVDDYGITSACKREWFSIADEYHLDHGNISAIIDEGFQFKNKKWELPEAKSTAENRDARMKWNKTAAPILSQ